jgi:hypothetical protein
LSYTDLLKLKLGILEFWISLHDETLKDLCIFSSSLCPFYLPGDFLLVSTPKTKAKSKARPSSLLALQVDPSFSLSEKKYP